MDEINSKPRKNTFSIILLIIQIIFFIGVLIYFKNDILSFTKQEIKVETVKVIDEQTQVINVVDKSIPSVVSIVSTKEVTQLVNCGPSDKSSNIPDEFKKFYKTPDEQICEKTTEQVKLGSGTGFIISSDGYIATNKHVVQNEKADYTVFLNKKDGTTIKVDAKVIARDPNNDIAILKIEKTNLPYLEFLKTDDIKVGQTVIAIGYALGVFDNTVSKGVVSGLSRNIRAVGKNTAETLYGLIQTDAAINFGNSGGPLLDISGKVIGMNVATVNAQNIGFAIPASHVFNAYEQVKNTGKIEKIKLPFIGVRYLPVNKQIKEDKELPFDYGVLVVKGNTTTETAIVAGSPADLAGIKEGDVILEFDGNKIDEKYTLSQAVRSYKIGDEIKLKIYSSNETKEIKLKLGSN